MRVSAGIVRRSDGKILIAQRGEGRKNARLWEFPGGKQEAGETAEDCLRRELTEELSLPVENVRQIASDEAQGITFDFLLADSDAEPHRTEHEALAFIEPERMTDYDFCPADAPVARRIAFSRKPLRHIFWDFDGTLMDTYPMMHQNVMRAIAKQGRREDPAEILELMMVTIGHCCAELDKRYGLPAGTMMDGYHEMVKVQDESLVKPLPGARELLQALSDRGCTHYLYTQRNQSAWDFLERADMRRYFADGIDKTGCFPDKPAPDALLSLISRYHLDPDTCLMVGDRPLDPESGLAAGMRGVLIDPVGRFSGCGVRWIVKDMRSLTDELLAEPLEL